MREWLKGLIMERTRERRELRRTVEHLHGAYGIEVLD